jgi:sulfopyruvate decarboxylase alpha subunit
MGAKLFTKAKAKDWPYALYRALKKAGISQVSYVPDAGHSVLIKLFDKDPGVRAVVLTTEEEGVAMAAGAWLGGKRAALLLQSSGVGNCINMLSLAAIGRFPLLMLVTMRGEWSEFNPWQVAMGHGAQPALEAMGVRVLRAERPEEVANIVAAAADLAFDADQQMAVLISQRILGKKKW